MAERPRTPSEGVAAGVCPACLGEKTVYKVAEGRDGPCGTCGGSGTWPPTAGPLAAAPGDEPDLDTTSKVTATRHAGADAAVEVLLMALLRFVGDLDQRENVWTLADLPLKPETIASLQAVMDAARPLMHHETVEGLDNATPCPYCVQWASMVDAAGNIGVEYGVPIMPDSIARRVSSHIHPGCAENIARHVAGERDA